MPCAQTRYVPVKAWKVDPFNVQILEYFEVVSMSKLEGLTNRWRSTGSARSLEAPSSLELQLGTQANLLYTGRCLEQLPNPKQNCWYLITLTSQSFPAHHHSHAPKRFFVISSHEICLARDRAIKKSGDNHVKLQFKISRKIAERSFVTRDARSEIAAEKTRFLVSTGCDYPTGTKN